MSGKFHIIDKSTWERSVYFDYYYTRIKCKYNLNANLDITHLVTEQKARGLRFFPVMLYVVMRAVNQNKEFRMSFNAEGSWGIGMRSCLATRFFTRIARLSQTSGANTATISTRSIAQ